MIRARVALLAAVCSVLLVSPVRAQVEAPTPSAPAVSPAPAVTAQAAILADQRTGKVLLGKQIHTPMAPASLTKVITALVANDLYDLDEIVTVTDAVNGVRGARLGLLPGQQLSIRELLYATLLLSGNDAAVALAAHHPGGYDAFIAEMNAFAVKLGAAESRFANPHGLDADGHQSSAWDLALFTRKLLDNPVLAEMVATPTHTITYADATPPRTVRNHNKLLFRRPDQTIGVKTGYTNRAGNCLIAAARMPAGTAITVVLKSANHYGDTTAMWDWFATGPAVASLGTLTLPKPKPAAAPKHQVRSAATPMASKAGWMVLPMSILAGAMLLTLGWPRRRTSMADAAEHHPWLEPVLAED